jgi:hypothetical protein
MEIVMVAQEAGHPLDPNVTQAIHIQDTSRRLRGSDPSERVHARTG